MNEALRAPLRETLEKLLRGGLETEWRERAYSDLAIEDVTRRLRALAPGDHASQLRVAGFTLERYPEPSTGLEESCRTCMYYSRHRGFCALPALKLPVKPEWSCRLWRV